MSSDHRSATDRPDQRSGRPQPGCPRVPVTASTAYTPAGIGGNPRWTARGQATRRPTADCTAASSTRPPTSASVSEHCLHTRGRWRRSRADCTGANSRSAHGGLHGGRLRIGQGGRGVEQQSGCQKVGTNTCCCSRAQEHKYITSHATEKGTSAKIKQWGASKTNTMTWIKNKMTWTQAESEEELSDGGTKTNHTNERD